MSELISRQKLIEALEEVERRFPYKVVGKPDTYSEFNMAWESCMDCVFSAVESQPQVDQWIPCSSGKVPEHEADVLVTLESSFKGIRYVINARYFAEMGVVYDDEWTGEGFYTYDSEYGWGKHEGVIAWMPAEPYKGAE